MTGVSSQTGRSLRRWRLLAVLFGLAACGGFFLAFTFWRELRKREPVAPETAAVEEVEDRLELRPASVTDLPGWTEDVLGEAVPALRSSCAALARQPGDRVLGDGPVASRVADWHPLCAGLVAAAAGGSSGLRAFLEQELRPFAVTSRGDPEAFFTGYYEPTLHGSRRRSERFRVPLYLRPPELVSVDLGKFRDDLKGRRIAGHVTGGELEPYHDRAAIESGGLAGRGLELVWVDDPIDAFFLHIQGSGRVELEEGGYLRVGYAAQNGHAYFAIGRELVERGALSLGEVSMQSIRHWLEEHPDEAGDVMAKNASYVFFQPLKEPGPVGSLGVVLTPGRSLAVDRHFLPLGVPLWVDTTFPKTALDEPERPLRRLVASQDTGGAIRGPARGDLFWGPGHEAAEVAGRMRQTGRLWVLLPRVRSVDG